MAKMYPPNKPDFSDMRNTAEPLLYELFRDQLPDSYYVFHSIAWQSQDRFMGLEEGEADFVIVHPHKGFAAIEAKSGSVYVEHGNWYYRDGTPMDKSPFQQASKFKHRLLGLLKNDPHWHVKWFHGTHTVALPHITVGDRYLGLEAEDSVILDQRARLDVRSWVETMFSKSRGQRNWDALTQQELAYLINLLAPVEYLKPKLSADFEQERQEFAKLDENQRDMLNFMTAMPRAAVAGCAGSGKTMLAANLALRLAQQGLNVLLTCFNRNLATYLADELLYGHPDELHIATFHSVSLRLIREADVSAEKAGVSTEHFFSDILPEKLLLAIDKLGAQYDVIVVDEAQDFKQSWWFPVQLLLNGGNDGMLYLFYDDNQNIYAGKRELSNVVSASIPLTRNYRNTQKIHQVVQRYHSGKNIVGSGPLGREVEVYAYRSATHMRDILRERLRELIEDQEIDTEEIIVLSPYGEKSVLLQQPQLGTYRLTRNWELDENEITCLTVQSFKGLESDVVILVEIDRRTSDEMIYIGSSRAKHHLIILHDQQCKLKR